VKRVFVIGTNVKIGPHKRHKKMRARREEPSFLLTAQAKAFRPYMGIHGLQRFPAEKSTERNRRPTDPGQILPLALQATWGIPAGPRSSRFHLAKSGSVANVQLMDWS
jgi:hypothetical protein